MEVSASICADQFVTFDNLVSSMVSEIGDIILKLGGYQGWALTSLLFRWVQGIQIELRKYLTCSICNSYSLVPLEECKLMRFEVGKHTGNTFGNVYLLL